MLLASTTGSQLPQRQSLLQADTRSILRGPGAEHHERFLYPPFLRFLHRFAGLRPTNGRFKEDVWTCDFRGIEQC
jgi:hypothetical protein